MNRFLLILFILFLVIFIGRQSHVIEKKKVKDANLGVSIEQYQVKWSNLSKYFEEVFTKIKEMIPRRGNR